MRRSHGIPRALFTVSILPMLLLWHLPSSVAAWGFAPHQAIGLAAESQLTPRAKAALARILQDTDTLAPGALARIATWPDDLRARPRFHKVAEGWGQLEIEEADQFNAEHPGNDQWHFVDLPLGAGAYPATDPAPGDPLRPFVGKGDIVHVIRRCVEILEAPTEPANFSKRQAVRWLVHLIGDLHQPLHVTSGYYNSTIASFKSTPIRLDDPVKAAKPGVLTDRGGNGLLFSAPSNLHALWDSCLPAVVGGASCTASISFSALANKLKTSMTPSMIVDTDATTPGDHHG